MSQKTDYYYYSFYNRHILTFRHGFFLKRHLISH